MKLIKLELLNLASLDRSEGEVIDFENGVLGNTSIFSIVGPMGSGKSTILDAICLALYNRAPRYRKTSGERNKSLTVFGNSDANDTNRLAPTDERNILTRGRKNGYSKLTFKANNGNFYRAEWNVQCKRIRFDNARTQLFQLYPENSDGETLWREEVRDWNTLPQIIGLDYEQFLRTVLIAQGSFAEFIKEDVNKRYKLLEKLVGSEEVYSLIAVRVKEGKARAEKALAEVSAGAEAERRNVLSDEDLAKLKVDIALLEEHENKIAEALKLIDKELAWHAEDALKLKQIEEHAKNLRAAREEMEKIKELSERLNLRDALLPAMDILRERERLDRAIADGAKSIDESSRKIEERKKEIDAETMVETELKAKSEKAVKDSADARPHIIEARRIRTLIEAATPALKNKEKAHKDAQKAKEEAEKALKDNAAAIAKDEQNVTAAKDKHARVNGEVEQRKKELRMLEKEFSEALDVQKKSVEGQNSETLQKRKDEAEANLADLKLAIEISGSIAMISTRLGDNQRRGAEISVEDTRLAKELAALKVEQLQAEVDALTRAETLMSSEAWGEHRHKLPEGEQCPLCGATHHPFTENPEMFEKSVAAISNVLGEKKTLLEKEKESKAAKETALAKNRGESSALEASAKKDGIELAKLRKRWTDIETAHSEWPGDKDALEALKESLEAESLRCRKDLADFMRVSKKIDGISKSLEETIRAKAKYAEESAAMIAKQTKALADAEAALAAEKALTHGKREQLEEKTAALIKAAEELSAEKNNIESLNVQFCNELQGKNPDEEEARLDKCMKDAAEAADAQTKKISALRTTLGEQQGALEHLRKQNDENAAERKARHEDLENWLDGFNRDKKARDADAADVAEENVAELLHSSRDWEAIRRNREERKRAESSAEALHAEALKKREEHQRLKPERGVEELEEGRKRLEAESKSNDLIGAKARLRNHNDSLERMGAAAEILREAQQRSTDWAEISEAIGMDGNRLRQIAQCYTLRFLIEQANNEIRKFNSRYELVQVKNSLGIRVIDHDRADDVRDTTSLSGGETFIVSLGLALGLSAISSRNVSFENLFIDEGFGSLDPDTLSTVIDSLASLQSQQGKKVGVISHTDMMSERIMTQIRVIKNGNTGSSRIEIVG